MRRVAGEFQLGEGVVYEGRTYRFPGTVCGICDDGQVIVRAVGAPNGDYAGMKHIYGPSQLRRMTADERLRYGL